MTGRVVHFEVPYEDTERASAFYRDAFGWRIMTMPGFDYTGVGTGPTTEQGMPTEPGFIGGGMFKREDPFSGPVVTIQCDDVEAALAKVEELGGTPALPPERVGDMGIAAYFRDPEGNLMGLWQDLTG